MLTKHESQHFRSEPDKDRWVMPRIVYNFQKNKSNPAF